MKPNRQTLFGKSTAGTGKLGILSEDQYQCVHRRTSLLAILFCDVCKLGGFQIDVVDVAIIAFLCDLLKRTLYRFLDM